MGRNYCGKTLECREHKAAPLPRRSHQCGGRALVALRGTRLAWPSPATLQLARERARSCGMPGAGPVALQAVAAAASQEAARTTDGAPRWSFRVRAGLPAFAEPRAVVSSWRRERARLRLLAPRWARAGHARALARPGGMRHRTHRRSRRLCVAAGHWSTMAAGCRLVGTCSGRAARPLCRNKARACKLSCTSRRRRHITARRHYYQQIEGKPPRADAARSSPRPQKRPGTARRPPLPPVRCPRLACCISFAVAMPYFHQIARQPVQIGPSYRPPRQLSLVVKSSVSNKLHPVQTCRQPRTAESRLPASPPCGCQQHRRGDCSVSA